MAHRPTRIDLPAAGHARNEELRRRTDALEQAATEQFADVGAIDPDKLKPDYNTISDAGLHRPSAGRNYDQFDVRDKVSGYYYCWVREQEPGAQVEWKLSEEVQMPDGEWAALWEVVQGDMPECPRRKDARGYRKISDCILMRARAERYRQYQIDQDRLRQEQQHGSTDELESLAAKSKGYVRVFSEVEMSQQQTTLERAQQAGFARSKFNQRLREGTAHQV